MPGKISLFVPGPTNMPDRVRQAMDISNEDHRAPGMEKFWHPLIEDLRKVFETSSGQPFIFPGTGSSGWEAALTNTLSKGDKVLSARFGQFSHLWIEMCKKLHIDVEVVDVEWGSGTPHDEFERILSEDSNHEIKAVLVTHNETSTGVTNDVKATRDLLNKLNHPALLFVDGVSSIGSIKFEMDSWGVDVAVSGSQKGFMLPAGLAISCVSQKALEIAKSANLPRAYFDSYRLLQLGPKPVDPLAGQRRDPKDRRTAEEAEFAFDVVTNFLTLFGVEQLPLVQQDHDRAAGCINALREPLILVGDTDRGVDDEERNIGLVDGLQGPHERVVLRVFVDFCLATHPGGVHKPDGTCLRLDDRVNCVASRAGAVVHHRPFLTDQPVEEGGLADIWPPDERDGEQLRIIADGILGT